MVGWRFLLNLRQTALLRRCTSFRAEPFLLTPDLLPCPVDGFVDVGVLLGADLAITALALAVAQLLFGIEYNKLIRLPNDDLKPHSLLAVQMLQSRPVLLGAGSGQEHTSELQ